MTARQKLGHPARLCGFRLLPVSAYAEIAHPGEMSRHRLSARDRVAFGDLQHDPSAVPGPWPRHGRPVKHDIESRPAIEDWPARPVTDAEIDVFTAGSSDFFDKLFGPS
jgi:hypothetical protein